MAPELAERADQQAYETVDWHTAGEPFRIVPQAPAPLLAAGLSVAERRQRAIADADVQWLRALLCSEPRGHADMYGGFVVPPDDDGADLGVLFWHKDGFSTACGHGTIALATWAVSSGRVDAPDEGTHEVRIDVPSGRVRALVRMVAGRVEDVTFVNVPSHLHARQVPVVTGRGTIEVDIAFGGAMYALVPAADLGLQVTAADLPDLIAAGREIRNALNAAAAGAHPTDPRLSGIYGTIFTEQVAPPEPMPHGGQRLHQRNVTVFADGEVDRSPCGSGTAARVAHLSARGELGVGDELVHESIVGTRFVARIVEHTTALHTRTDRGPAVIAAVTGTAHVVGTCRFTVDERDPLLPGFVLR